MPQPSSPTCMECGDTHRNGEHMCTRCPSPCPECQDHTHRPYCAHTPCRCHCHPFNQNGRSLPSVDDVRAALADPPPGMFGVTLPVLWWEKRERRLEVGRGGYTGDSPALWLRTLLESCVNAMPALLATIEGLERELAASKSFERERVLAGVLDIIRARQHVMPDLQHPAAKATLVDLETLVEAYRERDGVRATTPVASSK